MPNVKQLIQSSSVFFTLAFKLFSVFAMLHSMQYIKFPNEGSNPAVEAWSPNHWTNWKSSMS